jgi:hypothetical protein
MQNQDYVQTFSKLGKYLYYYALLFAIELLWPIFWNIIPGIVALTGNVALNDFYIIAIPYISPINLSVDVISFALMAVVVAKVKSLEKLSIEGINIRLFPKFFLGFILSLLGYFTNIIYQYIQPFLDVIPINSEFFLSLSIRDLIYAIFLVISTIFYFKTWNSLVNTYFKNQNLFTEYRIQKCLNAISLLKVGFILSFVVYGIPIFTNLLASIFYYDPLMGILYWVVDLINSTVYIVVDIILLFGYMNLGGNFKGLSAPKGTTNMKTIPVLGQNFNEVATPTFCPQCGNKIDPSSSFCASCGTHLEF